MARRTTAARRREAVNRILVPTDFSPGADAALRWATMMGEAFGAEILVLHVVDLATLSLAGYAPEMTLSPATSEMFTHLRDEANAQMARLKAAYPHVRTLIREGSPRGVILDVAEAEGADLIVMGTHGRTGLARVLFGSVAEHVVRMSPIPVFTVRGPEPRTAKPRARGRRAAARRTPRSQKAQ